MNSNPNERRQRQKLQSDRRHEVNLELMENRQLRREFRRKVERRNRPKSEDDGSSTHNVRVFKSAIDVFHKLKHEVGKF